MAVSNCISPRRLRGQKGWPRTPQLALFDSHLALCCGSEFLLGSFTGAPVGFKVSLPPGTLSRAAKPWPSDGLPVHHLTDSICCAEAPDLELCRHCSELCQDHTISSSLGHGLAAVDVRWTDGCSPVPFWGALSCRAWAPLLVPLPLRW